MYIPKNMEVTDFDKQLQVIKSHPLGILFNYAPPTGGIMRYLSGGAKPDADAVDGEMCATHLPFVFVEGEDGNNKLTAHMAAKNQHIEMLEKNPNCMIVFQSFDSYVTPDWYPLKKKTHKFVPTWDFAAVHVYGKATIIRDKKWLLKQLNMLTDEQEGKRTDVKENEEKWKVSDAPEKYVDKRMDEIVGLEITIEHIQAKFKVQQDVSEINVNGVINGYKQLGDNAVTEEMIKMTKDNYPKLL
ncbi:hypothetical protein C6P45_000599 [Maudiozyma exigua]|uniref:FMN-binding negative transcriptional regulator n=1 Tax=Maudiozyma exigua TaxID=34358 RepID=A0A9P6WDV5_MAUEX|nr:hypothetical protein C6P45_000599 [Kazachstania exigua]